MPEVITLFKVPRIRAPLHEEHLRKFGCLVRFCANCTIHLHHVRRNSGAGMKPGPEALVPLCWFHHAEGHQIGWKTWQRRYGLDLEVCAAWLAFLSRCQGRL